VSYYIDPTVTPGGIGTIGDPAASFPGTINASTEYLIKAGTTLDVGTGQVISSKNNVTVGRYGDGADPIITGTTSGARITIGGTTSNFTVHNINFIATATTGSLIYVNTTGGTNLIDHCTFIGLSTASGGASISLNTALAITGLTISNCTIDKGNYGISCLVNTPGLTYSGITISGNTITNTNLDPIRLSVESTAGAWSTSNINNVTISGNTIDRCAGHIRVRNGNLTDRMNPVNLGSNITLSNNRLTNSALTNTAANQGAAIALHGCTGGVVSGNYLYNCFCAGGQIETGSNSGLLIENNYVEHSVSNNGIDAVGIFDDEGNVSSTVRYNTIVDCPGYGVANPPPNYGGGIATYRARNSRYYGNLIKASGRGFTYGDPLETGNMMYNNTLIDNTRGALYRSGSGALAGALLFRNNIVIGSSIEGGGVSNATLVSNVSYATTTLAGIVVDGVGLPIGLAPGSPCISAGIGLDQYTVSKNGYSYYSTPSVGAHEVPRPFYMFAVGWFG